MVSARPRFDEFFDVKHYMKLQVLTNASGTLTPSKDDIAEPTAGQKQACLTWAHVSLLAWIAVIVCLVIMRCGWAPRGLDAICEDGSQEVSQQDKALEAVEASLEHCGVAWYQWRMLIVTWLGWMVDGAEEEVIGLLMPTLSSTWGIRETQFGRLSAYTSFATMVSAVVLGHLGDRFGRRQIFTGSCLVMSAGALSSAFATNYTYFVVARIICKVGVGGLLAIDIPVLHDVMPASRVSAYVTLLHLGFSGGSFYARLMGWVILNNGYSWRGYVVVCAMPAVFAFIGRASLPEGPHALVLQGRLEEADEVLGDIARTNGVAEPCHLKDHMKEVLANGGEGGKTSSKMSIANGNVSLRIMLLAMIAFGMQIGSGMQGWLAAVANHYGHLDAVFYETISATSFVTSLTHVLCFLLITRGFAAWDLLMASILGCFLTLVSLSYCLVSAHVNWTLVAVLMVVCWGSCWSVAWGTLSCVCTELFPPSVMGAGFGFNDAASRFASILSPLAASAMLTTSGAAITNLSLAQGWMLAAALAVFLEFRMGDSSKYQAHSSAANAND